MDETVPVVPGRRTGALPSAALIHSDWSADLEIPHSGVAVYGGAYADCGLRDSSKFKFFFAGLVPLGRARAAE
jgi:hypothetical protein